MMDLSQDPLVQQTLAMDPNARKFYGFMGPQMANLEKDMAENLKVLDDMTKKWEDERTAKQKRENQKYVPQPLKNDGQSLTQISKKIGGLFRYTNFPERHVAKPEKTDTPADMLNLAVQEMQESLKNFTPPIPGGDGAAEQTEVKEEPEVEEEEDDEFINEDLIPSQIPELTEMDRMLLLSHSMAAYATKLPQEHRERFYTRIINDTTDWISALFRVKDSTAMYHDDPLEGLINTVRLALIDKYPDYLEKGFDCLYTKPPVIYISAASHSGLAHTLCRGLGVPESCICVVPIKDPEPGQIHKIDTDAFESLVNDHIASTREPVLLIAYASTPQLAAVDPLQKLKSVCKAKNIWLHVDGLNLATLCLMNVPTKLLSARTSDSCTLDMAAWFGFPGAPCVTLYRKESQDTARLLGLTSDARNRRLKCLPLWVALQAVGVDGLIERVKTAVQTTSDVLSYMSKIPTVSILNKKPPAENKKGLTEYKGFGDFVGQLLSAILVFEMATPVVIFKYGKSRDEQIPEVAPYASQEQIDQKQSDDERLSRYFDCLNVWFVDTVRRECPCVYLEAIQVEGGGTAIKFSPLEHAYTMGTTSVHIEEFLHIAQRQLSVMDATVSHRGSFIQVVEAQDNLTYIEIPGYAGIGAVQYIPTDWLESLHDLPPKGKDEINKINMELVHQLKTNDSAFSLGRTLDGMACARFGLISQDTDMEELLGLVYTTGKEIEESSRFVEQMAELVKQGIEKANQDLEKETENRLIQEGVLKQIPIVGSFMNWLSPTPKEVTNLKGRAFNLSSGTVKSTEETYKHHMQILDAPLETPKRQGSLKSILKPLPGATSPNGVPLASPTKSSVNGEALSETITIDNSASSSEGSEGGETNSPAVSSSGAQSTGTSASSSNTTTAESTPRDVQLSQQQVDLK